MDNGVKVARARAVSATVHTDGWSIIKALAATIQREVENTALECDDDDKVVRLQHKAQAVKEFINLWMNEVERAQNPDAPNTVDDFVTLATEA